MDWSNHFDQIWCIDFEFIQTDGERPSPVCLVARELFTNRQLRAWKNELVAMREPPFSIDSRTLVVAYYASAELGCFIALGWAMPTCVLDLCVEFKCRTSGLSRPGGAGLLGALMHFGLDAINAADKDRMRELIIKGGPYNAQERQDVLEYCESDVTALIKLLPVMRPEIDLPRALIRGRYMAAVARMEWTGIPIDIDALATIKENWNTLKNQLISRIDSDYGVYDGTTFKADRWARYVATYNIPWPRLASGQLALDEDTFREIACSFPQVAPIRELRKTIAQLRLNDLPVGSDGRNRCILSAFGSKTGRNQPSTSKFIFGLPAWARGLIRPGPGKALAYIDYSQQELAIAAALSADLRMQLAYESGDFYLEFAKMAHAVPADATKDSHSVQRDQFKTVALGVLYGLSEQGLARKLSIPLCEGRELLRLHKKTFRRFWEWSNAVQDRGILTGMLQTVFGWKVHAGVNTNVRSLRNFPMQGNGAEMLRLACCDATEAGINICAPIHDAVLIEADDIDINAAVEAMQGHMRRASEIVLGGFPLRTDAKLIRFPDRYIDKRGEAMWNMIIELCRRPSA